MLFLTGLAFELSTTTRTASVVVLLEQDTYLCVPLYVHRPLRPITELGEIAATRWVLTNHNLRKRARSRHQQQQQPFFCSVYAKGEQEKEEGRRDEK